MTIDRTEAADLGETVALDLLDESFDGGSAWMDASTKDLVCEANRRLETMLTGSALDVAREASESVITSA